MEAAEHAWRPLGELLLSKNVIAREELEHALSEQEQTGKLLGAILVDRGFISGPALAVALAEQFGVELDQQHGFGTGVLPDELEPENEATVVRFEPPPPSLEAVPDPEPDPELEQLETANLLLQEEIERLHAELTKLRVVEAPEPDPEPEPELPSSHLLFVPTPARYLLVERQGPPPDAGDEVALSEGRFVVGKLGPAPMPGERRACAFLLARA